MPLVYSYSMTKQCGPARPFKPNCVNQFSTKSGKTDCYYSHPPSTFCLTPVLPGCNNPTVVIPRGFIVTQEGGGEFGTGPYQTEESAFGSPYNCGGSKPFPGAGGIPNVGCGYKAYLEDYPGGVNNPPIYWAPTIIIGFVPTAVMEFRRNGDDNNFQQPSDVYAADNDFSTLDYMQVLSFRWHCGQTLDDARVFTAVPFR